MRNANCGLRIADWGLRAACLLTVGLLTGCGRELVITQAEYINTAMHEGRPEGSRTGEPLELNIVYVYPEDLKHEANARLDPQRSITCDVWFADRPKQDDAKDMSGRGSRFWLPRDQILLISNDPSAYGTPIRAAARGSAHDKTDDVIRRKLDFKGPMGSRDSAVYVFARFTDAEGRVLPERPARFSPPGDYGRELRVHVGARHLETRGSE